VPTALSWGYSAPRRVEGAGFHAFRHAFASLHIERGTNIVRLSRLLGHHKPSFTLDVYAHLLDDGLGDPLDVGAEIDPRRWEQGENVGHATAPAAAVVPLAQVPVATG
jgi:integrase